MSDITVVEVEPTIETPIEPVVPAGQETPVEGSAETQRTQWKPKYEALKVELDAIALEKSSWQKEKEELSSKYSVLEQEFNKTRETLTSLNAQRENEYKQSLLEQDDALDMLELLELKFSTLTDKSVTFEKFYTDYKTANPKRFTPVAPSGSSEQPVKTIQTVRRQAPVTRPTVQEQILDHHAISKMTTEQWNAYKQSLLKK